MPGQHARREARAQLRRGRLHAAIAAVLMLSSLGSGDAASFRLHGAAQARREEGAAAAAPQQVRALRKLREAEWAARMQPLGPLLEAYSALHRSCEAAGGESVPYLIVRMTGDVVGVGNQLPSIVTGFLLALLTERCLFVDFAPFHTFFTHELDFAWERHQTRLAAAAHDVASRTYTLEHSRAGYNAFAEEWMFQDFRESLRGWQEVVLLDDLDYSAALLQSNPHYQDWFAAHFPTRDVFAPLAAFLLRVALEHEARLAAFQEASFGAAFTIGLQIRRRKCNTDTPGHELACADRPGVEAYCTVARTLQLARGLRDADVRFFLAADEAEVYAQVAGILGEARVIYTANGIAPGPAGGALTNASSGAGGLNPGTKESALVDMALLARCDDHVTTLASSFGYVAAAWAGSAPVAMLFGRHSAAQNPYWARALSSEPCFWQARPMMAAVNATVRAQFRTNPFWSQYLQCHY